MRILLITVDTLRYDEAESLSFLKDLEFARFEKVFTAGTSTPFAFPAIFSGVYVSHYHRSFPSFVQILKGMGFRTFGHNGGNIYCSDAWGYHKGFDYFEERFIGKRLTDPYPPIPSVDEISETFGEWLNEIDRDENVFAWLHIMDLHGRHDFLKYLDEKMRRIAKRIFKHDYEDKEEEKKDYAVLREHILKHLDATLGDLIKETLHIEDVVIVTSDHGEEMLEHGDIGHFPKPFDELIHVPFYIKVRKEIIDRLKPQHLLSLVDLPNLILHLAGIKGKLGIGIDPFEEKRELVYVEGFRAPNGHHDPSLRGERIVAIRSEKWKVMIKGSEKWMYDLTADPDEQESLLPSKKVLKRVYEFLKFEQRKSLEWKARLLRGDAQFGISNYRL